MLEASDRYSPAGPPFPEPQTLGGGSLPARLASFVKLPHTLFALPFALVGVVLATYRYPDALDAATLGWVILAFAAARFAAMGFNRIVDRSYDARNPRTRMRELPAGRLTLGQARIAVVVASLLFVFAAWQLNPLCALLAPVALAWVFFYSYTKRFTALSHLVLGFALGIAPVGAYLALAGEWAAPWYSLVVIAASVMCWVAGFDVLYALQDVDFDRAEGLRSIPARLGATRALAVARVLHLLAVAGFLAVWAFRWFPVGTLYLVAVAVMAALLAYEHVIVRPRAGERLDVTRIDRAFFKVNVTVSTTFLALVLLDRVVA